MKYEIKIEFYKNEESIKKSKYSSNSYDNILNKYVKLKNIYETEITDEEKINISIHNNENKIIYLSSVIKGEKIKNVKQNKRK